MEEIELHPGAASRVHYATDPRIRALAQAAWRMRTKGSRADWLALGKDNPDALITEAREWVRAAVAGGILPPPEPSVPTLAGGRAGHEWPFAERCSFCGKSAEHVTIVLGPGCSICSDCITLVAIVRDEADQSGAAHYPDLSRPEPEHVSTALLREAAEDDGGCWADNHSDMFRDLDR